MIGLQCADIIFEEMCRIAAHAVDAELLRFPDLKDKVLEIVYKLLRQYMIPTQKMISNIIALELSYINISHPDFIGGKQAINLAQQNRVNMKQQQQQQQQLLQQNLTNGSSPVTPGGPTTIIPSIGTMNPSEQAGSMQSSVQSSETSSKKSVVMSTGQGPMPTASGTNPLMNSANDNRGFLGFLRPAQPTPSTSTTSTGFATPNRLGSDSSNIIERESNITTRDRSSSHRDSTRNISTTSAPSTRYGMIQLPQVLRNSLCSTMP